MNCTEHVLLCKNVTSHGVNLVEWSTSTEHTKTQSRIYQLLDTYTPFSFYEWASINKQKTAGAGPWDLNTDILVITLKNIKHVTEDGKKRKENQLKEKKDKKEKNH